MPYPSIVGVAGMIGCGKTTLARALAHQLKWQVVPRSVLGARYLRDLFHDQRRWAFETQVSFLAQRVHELVATLEDGYSVLLDRTIYEDIDVFAAHFRSTGQIDARSYATYRTLAEHFVQTLPRPDLIVYCQCSLGTIRRRLAERGRDFDTLYPPGHVETLYRLYGEWRDSFRLAPVYTIDSDVLDLRDSRIVASIRNELLSLLTSPQAGDPAQLSLFPESSRPSAQLNLLQGIMPIPAAARVASAPRRARPEERVLPFPSAYIAAPFTAAASEEQQQDASMLFPHSAPHGRIPKGRYRQVLLRISRELRAIGFNTILPHRDYNQWGRRLLEPGQVITLCTEGVIRSDVFVGLLSSSTGSHYECGLACALSKPTLFIQCQELGTSFMATGVASAFSQSLLVECQYLEEVPSAVRCPAAEEFLRRFIGAGS